jgi:membrane peptidoglycan carboxypeptidase
VSAKTGTAEFYLDNLTVGWTPTLLTAVWVGNEQQSCLQPKDDAYMAKEIAKGNVYDDDQEGIGYPFSPHDLAHYGLQPAHPSTPDCGHLDGVISGYSGAAPIWHAYMLAALKGVPDTWYTPPPDLITVSTGQGFDDSNFYLPGTGPDAPAGQCTYYGVTPLPTQTCTYAGPSAAPPPPTTSPSPSPGGGPTPTPSPSPT